MNRLLETDNCQIIALQDRVCCYYRSFSTIQDEATIVRTMIQQAKQKIVVADHTKIGITTRAINCEANKVDMLITGLEAPHDQVAAFEGLGLQVLQV